LDPRAALKLSAFETFIALSDGLAAPQIGRWPWHRLRL